MISLYHLREILINLCCTVDQIRPVSCLTGLNINVYGFEYPEIKLILLHHDCIQSVYLLMNQHIPTRNNI